MFRTFVVFIFFSFVGLSYAQNESRYLQGNVIEGPYKTNIVDGGELSVLQTGDVEFPSSLVLDVTGADNSKVRSLVDKYDVAGSDPKVESIFFYPVNGKRNVLVLVSWELNNRGIGTYGTLYQVYGYERGLGNQLVENKLIRFDKNLGGIDGYQEGAEQNFLYKNAALVKSYIKKEYSLH